MSNVVQKIDHPAWDRRLIYRLRRERYRQLEWEAGLEPIEEAEPEPEAHPHAHVHKHDHAHKHEMEKAIETLRDQLLRGQAEFENYRKRIKREERQRIELATQRLVEQLLPVLDNFTRALANPGETVEGLHAGIDMVHKQLDEVLMQQGLEHIEPTGEPFDPKVHEAIGVVADSGLPDNTVVEVLQGGFMLKGRLLRPAMVRVARAS